MESVIRMAAVTSRKSKSAGNRTENAEHGSCVVTAFLRNRDLILLGRMASGTWIVEGLFCEHFNLNRTPVRGVCRLLQKIQI